MVQRNMASSATGEYSPLEGRPVQLRDATWRFIAGRLAEATDAELLRIGIDRRTTNWGKSASKLLVWSGAWREANLMARTTILVDTEYLLGPKGAGQLASASPVIEVRILGSDKPRWMRRQKLLSLLAAGTEVDQLD